MNKKGGESYKPVHAQPKHETLEEKMLSNLIELQKIHANMAEKFDKLTNQIANLLALFENSARSIAKQGTVPGMEKDKEFLDKIDRMLDQNKTIARGLTLMEERMRERLYGTMPPQQQMPPQPINDFAAAPQAPSPSWNMPQKADTRPLPKF